MDKILCNKDATFDIIKQTYESHLQPVAQVAVVGVAVAVVGFEKAVPGLHSRDPEHLLVFPHSHHIHHHFHYHFPHLLGLIYLYCK